MLKYESATLSELSDSLIKFLNKYPELADRKVSISAECGYSTTGIASPIQLYEFTTSDSIIHILTNDDIDINNNLNAVAYSLDEIKEEDK